MQSSLNILCAKVSPGFIACLITALALCFADRPQAAGKPDPETIVEKADLIRFPASSFQVDVKITNIIPDDEPTTRQYRILSKGADKSLVQTTAPAIDKGQILLMRSNDLWLFMPSTSQPIRLPLSQRLTGQVANGDLARAKFSGNYTAKLLRNDSIGGNNYHVIELIAAHRGVTYNRVLYWVNKTNYWPLKAEFYTRSGRLLKTCLYQNYKKIDGKVRPLQLVMEDALRKGRKSILDYSNMLGRKIPDKVFTKDYLKKLQ